MELKGDRLREERTDTFMPRRLALKADAEIARERQSAPRGKGSEGGGGGGGPEQLLLRLATAAAKEGSGGATRRRPAAAAATTTLADYVDEDEEEDSGNSASVPAILRDGVSEEQRRQAATALRGVHGYDGLGGDRDPLAGLDMSFDQSFFGAEREEEVEGGGAADGVYLLRVLPRASFCSRREASAMIASGQVKVNNVVERNPFRLVKAEDDVHVAGHTSRLRFAPPRLWMYHKPANVIVSRNDTAGRTLIGKHARILGMDHLIPVGSLPMRAHGILLLTNDGELSRYLENPRANMQRTYLLRVRPAIDPILAHKLNTEGININGRQYRGAMEFMVNPAAKSRYSLKVKVRGEAMPISHVMQHLGRKIERGGRVSFGAFSLSTLAVGSLREVTVPPFYADRLGAVWKPFVERDWPYFRRQRVRRLRHLCRYRELTPRELEELDNFTYEEMQEALSFDAQELTATADARGEEDAWRGQPRPPYAHGQAIPFDFPASLRRQGSGEGEDVGTLEGSEWAERPGSIDEPVIEDITCGM